MMKLSPAEYSAWRGTVQLGTQRLGQAFINHFYERIRDAMPHPELFYATDPAKAEKIIFERYVENV